MFNAKREETNEDTAKETAVTIKCAWLRVLNEKFTALNEGNLAQAAIKEAHCKGLYEALKIVLNLFDLEEGDIGIRAMTVLNKQTEKGEPADV